MQAPLCTPILEVVVSNPHLLSNDIEGSGELCVGEELLSWNSKTYSWLLFSLELEQQINDLLII